MKEDTPYYRRNLPHYQPEHATYFVTFRLAGSLPIEVIARMKEGREADEKLLIREKSKVKQREQLYDLQKRYFGKFDTLLDDSKSGPLWLGESEVADLVAEAVHYRDGKAYDLYAFCIMPNHVHMVFAVGRQVGRRDSSPYVVTDILENLKWYTALKGNQLLKRTGQFWQHESYDHVVRDGRELERIVGYVLNNPVKAGLVKSWSKWRWSYVSREMFADTFDERTPTD